MEMSGVQSGEDVLKLSLGPIQYYWPRDTVIRFYESIAETPVDIVYLGEAVCSRRHELRLADWLEIAARLQEAGKQPVLSTLVLIESGVDLAAMRKIVDNGRYLVEANDMGAVHMLDGAPFVAGPMLNVYNAPTLSLLHERGAARWVAPLEFSREGWKEMLAHKPASLQTEIFAYGRMPLAYSARCFTARYHNLPKEKCQFACIDYPDGLMLQTREHTDFLVFNGIQTQSAKVCNLIGELHDMRAMGIDVLRISPQAQHTDTVVQAFDDVRLGKVGAAEGAAMLWQWMPHDACDGYWHCAPGMDYTASLMQQGEM